MHLGLVQRQALVLAPQLEFHFVLFQQRTSSPKALSIKPPPTQIRKLSLKAKFESTSSYFSFKC